MPIKLHKNGGFKRFSAQIIRSQLKNHYLWKRSQLSTSDDYKPQIFQKRPQMGPFRRERGFRRESVKGGHNENPMPHNTLVAKKNSTQKVFLSWVV